MRTDNDLSKIINQSGFPLQAAIARRVHDRRELGWSVVYQEHGWQLDGDTGFADLVVEDQHRTSVLVMECKKVIDGEWIFLEEEGAITNVTRARLWITNTANHGREHFGYYEAHLMPPSRESMYCVVAGQDAKARPMLERVAAETLQAMEAIAAEEHAVWTERGRGVRMYAAVIVTTARLVISRFDPGAVSLKTGAAEKLSHETVPWIRFRKAFSAEQAVVPGEDVAWNFAALGAAKEKTVFVVSADSIEQFLAEWSVNGRSLSSLDR